MTASARHPADLPAIRRDTVVSGIPDSHVDGQRTTVGVPMVGDPWISPWGGLLGWRRAQYATAMAQKQGLIGADASHLAAHSGGSNTVVFVSIDTRREVARFTIPARVMAFDPFRKPLRLADQREGT